jgi:hypothetical protein
MSSKKCFLELWPDRTSELGVAAANPMSVGLVAEVSEVSGGRQRSAPQVA